VTRFFLLFSMPLRFTFFFHASHGDGLAPFPAGARFFFLADDVMAFACPLPFPRVEPSLLIG